MATGVVSFRIRLMVSTLSAEVILLVAVPLVLPRHYIMAEAGIDLAGPVVLMSAQLVARNILVPRFVHLSTLAVPTICIRAVPPIAVVVRLRRVSRLVPLAVVELDRVPEELAPLDPALEELAELDPVLDELPPLALEARVAREEAPKPRTPPHLLAI